MRALSPIAVATLVLPTVLSVIGCRRDGSPAATPAPAPAGSTTATEARGPRVGLVFDIGGRGDKSFNDAADRGLVLAKQQLGAQTEVVEPGEGADREAALRQMASRKMDLVL